MTARTLILADPALLAQTNLGWGSAGSFTEPFVANNIDWDAIEVVEEPVDFTGAESSFTDDFAVPPWA